MEVSESAHSLTTSVNSAFVSGQFISVSVKYRKCFSVCCSDNFICADLTSILRYFVQGAPGLAGPRGPPVSRILLPISFLTVMFKIKSNIQLTDNFRDLNQRATID